MLSLFCSFNVIENDFIRWILIQNFQFKPIELFIYESNCGMHSRTRNSMFFRSIYRSFLLFEYESSLKSVFKLNPLHSYSNELILTLISMQETCHLLHGFMRSKSTFRVTWVCGYLDVEMVCHTKTMAKKYYGPCHNQILSTGNQFKRGEVKEDLLGFHCGNCHSI